jgi:hypothetical protein
LTPRSQCGGGLCGGPLLKPAALAIDGTPNEIATVAAAMRNFLTLNLLIE